METVVIQKEEAGAALPAAVVSATDLARRYGEGDTAVDALRGVNLEVARRKLTAVMGPSGSGKSTLMHLLAALDRPTSGYVVVAGTRLGQLSDTEITKLRREHIGFVFQFFNLLPMLTADENVRLPLSIAGEKPNRDWYEDLLKKVGLADRRTHRPQAARDADRVRDRPRRRDDQRRLRPHRHDQQGVRHDLPAVLQERGRRHRGQGGVPEPPGQWCRHPDLPPVVAPEGPGA